MASSTVIPQMGSLVTDFASFMVMSLSCCCFYFLMPTFPVSEKLAAGVSLRVVARLRCIGQVHIVLREDSRRYACPHNLDASARDRSRTASRVSSLPVVEDD